MNAMMAEVKEYNKQREEKLNTLLEQVKSNQLSREDAAMSLAGWQLKWHNERGRPLPKHFDHDEFIKRYRFEIDSRLPNWDGMIRGVHC